jgi:hypothetical protein
MKSLLDAQQIEMASRLLLLKILDACMTMGAREDAIVVQFGIMAPTLPHSRTDVATQLESLRKLGFVVYEVPAIGCKRWTITADGKTEFARNEYQEM